MESGNRPDSKNDAPRSVRRRKTGKKWSHLDEGVGYLVRETEDFIVFLDTDGDVDWESTDEFKHDVALLGVVSNRMAGLRSLPSEHLSKKAAQAFGVMQAEAIVRAFERDKTGAHAILDQAHAFFAARMRETARLWYLGGGALAVGFVACLGWPTLALVGLAVPIARDTQEHIFLGALCGAFGAAFSVLLRSKRALLDISAGRLVHYASGGVRVLTGAAAGVVAVFAMMTKLVLPELTGRAGFALASTVAGFSERWVPSLIERVEVAAGANSEQIGQGGKGDASKPSPEEKTTLNE
jgi:hypothetical protein